jgi:hypothetical protein
VKVEKWAESWLWSVTDYAVLQLPSWKPQFLFCSFTNFCWWPSHPYAWEIIA